MIVIFAEMNCDLTDRSGYSLNLPIGPRMRMTNRLHIILINIQARLGILF